MKLLIPLMFLLTLLVAGCSRPVVRETVIERPVVTRETVVENRIAVASLPLVVSQLQDNRRDRLASFISR